MPIKTLSKRASFPMEVLGKLRLGSPMSKASNGKTKSGEPLPHFRVTFNQSGLLPDVSVAQDLFTEMYGENPSVIDGVQFAFNGIRGNLEMDLEQWAMSKTGNRICTVRCDGETASVVKDGAYTRVNEACHRNPSEMHCADCKPRMRLFFWLPEFCARLGVVGGFVIESSSITNMGLIENALQFAQANVTDMRKVVFMLQRVPMQISGKPHYALSLTVSTAAAQMAIAQANMQISAGLNATHALPANANAQMQNEQKQLASGTNTPAETVQIEARFYARDGWAYFKSKEAKPRKLAAHLSLVEEIFGIEDVQNDQAHDLQLQDGIVLIAELNSKGAIVNIDWEEIEF